MRVLSAARSLPLLHRGRQVGTVRVRGIATFVPAANGQPSGGLFHATVSVTPMAKPRGLSASLRAGLARLSAAPRRVVFVRVGGEAACSGVPGRGW